MPVIPAALNIPTTIGAKVDLRTQLKEQKEQAQAIVDAYDAHIKELELALLEQLDKEESLNGGGKTATVSIREAIVPQVDSWDDFYKYISRTKYFHLLERRPSVSGCRELFETKGKIPGVVPFIKRTLNFTSKKG